jgi:hypothetical protein
MRGMFSFAAAARAPQGDGRAGRAWKGSVCRRVPALAVLRGDTVATQPHFTLQSDAKIVITI